MLFHVAVCRLFDYDVIGFSSWSGFPALSLAMVWIPRHRAHLSFDSLDRDVFDACLYICSAFSYMVPSKRPFGGYSPAILSQWSPELFPELSPELLSRAVSRVVS